MKALLEIVELNANDIVTISGSQPGTNTCIENVTLDCLPGED